MYNSKNGQKESIFNNIPHKKRFSKTKKKEAKLNKKAEVHKVILF